MLLQRGVGRVDQTHKTTPLETIAYRFASQPPWMRGYPSIRCGRLKR